MTVYLLVIAIIIITCIICNKISSKVGLPMLLIFIVLGMLFGSDGIFKIHFDDFELAEKICSFALIFIMFYGGFGTKWSIAKPVFKQSIVLSSLGTMATAGIVGLFCYYALSIELLESFLIGAVISSTDAASVFSILRFKHLNLKYNTASLLEIESGSNDPFSYMLTIIVLSLMGGNTSFIEFINLLFMQVVLGLVFGFGVAKITKCFLKKVRISSSGLWSTFFVAIAILSYAAPSLLAGNGYLSTYIAGIVLGNAHLDNKKELVHFFDGITSLMQMLLFFLLGLLAFPSELPHVFLIGLLISLFLTFIARPLVVFVILTFFKSPINQKLLVSWSGMRGAASIVFAIMVVIDPVSTNHDIFHIVFFIVLFSILVQGTLIPYVAKKLDMTDSNENVMKTFNDYDDDPIEFIQFKIPDSHPWIKQKIGNIILPADSLIVLIIRDTRKIVPNGNTTLLSQDAVILSGSSMIDKKEGSLVEIQVQDDWIHKSISQTPLKDELVILIKRNNKIVVPKGKTKLNENDILVIIKK